MNIRNELELKRLGKAEIVTGVTESSNLAAIFAIFLRDFFANDMKHSFMSSTGKFFMFPIAFLTGALQATFAWRRVYLDSAKDKSLLVRALVESVSSVGVGIAVFGSLLAEELFADAAPAIFAGIVGAKAIFSAGSSIYYFNKMMKTSDPEEKASYAQMAKANAIGAGLGASATVGIIGTLILLKPVYSTFGMVAGVVGTTYTVYQAATASSPKDQGYILVPSEQESEVEVVVADELKKELSQNAKLAKIFANDKTVSSPVAEEKSSTNTSKVETQPESGFYQWMFPSVKKESEQQEVAFGFGKTHQIF